jgi:hypothetical protein
MNEPMQNHDPMVDWRAAIREFRERLERDYVGRVSRYAGGFGVWGNSSSVGYEIPLGGRVGKLAGTTARYARRNGFLGIFGRRVRVRELADIEGQFRQEIDQWLADQERKSTTIPKER